MVVRDKGEDELAGSCITLSLRWLWQYGNTADPRVGAIGKSSGVPQKCIRRYLHVAPTWQM